MLWSRSPFGVSAGSSPAPVSRVGRSSASKLRSFEHSFLLRATTAHRASRDDRSRRSAAAVGQHPSLSGAPRERCPLAPRNAAYRAAGPLGGAGRIATRLLAARPPQSCTVVSALSLEQALACKTGRPLLARSLWAGFRQPRRRSFFGQVIGIPHSNRLLVV